MKYNSFEMSSPRVKLNFTTYSGIRHYLFRELERWLHGNSKFITLVRYLSLVVSIQNDQLTTPVTLASEGLVLSYCLMCVCPHTDTYVYKHPLNKFSLKKKKTFIFWSLGNSIDSLPYICLLRPRLRGLQTQTWGPYRAVVAGVGPIGTR